MENYKLLGRIGKGAHGLVFKALDTRNGRTVALKQITIASIANGIPKNTMREICTLRALQSKYVSFNCLALLTPLIIDCTISGNIHRGQRRVTRDGLPAEKSSRSSEGYRQTSVAATDQNVHENDSFGCGYHAFESDHA